jgi:nicotinate-nucleotide adenylyltransferase
MRIGVMGGTFDPIHNGHLVAASEVAHEFNLERVIFAPTGEPWHKTRTSTPAELRYLMAVIATAADPRFAVTRVDIDRPGPTYTVDTIADLDAQFEGSDVTWFFITGADALADILQWRDAERVLARVELVGVTRPGHELTDPGLPKSSVHLMEIPAVAISSTDIRSRVAKGAPIEYLVPDGVARFIEKHRLYREAA